MKRLTVRLNSSVKLLMGVAIGMLILASCHKKKVPKVDYANEMRQFIMEISAAAKAENPDFLIVPQNGAQLATVSRKQDGVLATDYVAAIDGQGQEDLFYGYQRDDKASPASVRNERIYFLDLLETQGVEALVTDYCSKPDHISDAYIQNTAKGYASFVAEERKLTEIPDYWVMLNNENSDDITQLSEAQNFLYLINPTETFANKANFMTAVKNTNYDLVIMDRDFNNETYTADEIESLKWKENGGKRLVLCYMSIGEAEDYRSYWKTEWKKRKTSPEWLYRENRKWRGNYKVFYWMPEWKTLIYGNESSYLTSILNKGFDGAYLDIVDAYAYYENL